VVAVWLNAYYLQYQTDKAKFFETLWSLWNWQDVESRYERAQRLDLGLPGTVEDAVNASAEAPVTH